MIFFKKMWTFLADFSGVIATVGYAIVGIGYLINFLTRNKLFLFIFLFLFPFVIFSAIKWLRTSYRRFSQRITDIEIDDEIEQLEKTEFHQDISKLLPNNSLMKKMRDSLAKKVKSWAEDGAMGTFTLYLDVTSETNDLYVQAQCRSKWKSEETYFYVGKNWETTPSEIFSHDISTSHQEINLFYKKYPDWRKAIVKAYEAIKDKIPNEFKLLACSHYDNAFHFEFSYNFGIRRTEAFELAGNILKNLKSGKTIEI